MPPGRPQGRHAGSLLRRPLRPWARVTEAGPEGQQPVCAGRPSMMKESLSPQLPVC